MRAASAIASSASLTTWIDAIGPNTSSQTTACVGLRRRSGPSARRTSPARRRGGVRRSSSLAPCATRPRDLLLDARRAPARRSAGRDRCPGPCRCRPCSDRVCATNRSMNVVRDRLDDVDALGGGADLTVVEEARPGGAGHRDVEIRVLEHDQRIDAAQLEVDALQLLAPRAPRSSSRPRSTR